MGLEAEISRLCGGAAAGPGARAQAILRCRQLLGRTDADEAKRLTSALTSSALTAPLRQLPEARVPALFLHALDHGASSLALLLSLRVQSRGRTLAMRSALADRVPSERHRALLEETRARYPGVAAEALRPEAAPAAPEQEPWSRVADDLARHPERVSLQRLLNAILTCDLPAGALEAIPQELEAARLLAEQRYPELVRALPQVMIDKLASRYLALGDRPPRALFLAVSRDTPEGALVLATRDPARIPDLLLLLDAGRRRSMLRVLLARGDGEALLAALRRQHAQGWREPAIHAWIDHTLSLSGRAGLRRAFGQLMALCALPPRRFQSWREAILRFDAPLPDELEIWRAAWRDRASYRAATASSDALALADLHRAGAPADPVFLIDHLAARWKSATPAQRRDAFNRLLQRLSRGAFSPLCYSIRLHLRAVGRARAQKLRASLRRAFTIVGQLVYELAGEQEPFLELTRGLSPAEGLRLARHLPDRPRHLRLRAALAYAAADRAALLEETRAAGLPEIGRAVVAWWQRDRAAATGHWRAAAGETDIDWAERRWVALGLLLTEGSAPTVDLATLRDLSPRGDRARALVEGWRVRAGAATNPSISATTRQQLLPLLEGTPEAALEALEALVEVDLPFPASTLSRRRTAHLESSLARQLANAGGWCPFRQRGAPAAARTHADLSAALDGAALGGHNPAWCTELARRAISLEPDPGVLTRVAALPALPRQERLLVLLHRMIRTPDVTTLLQSAEGWSRQRVDALLQAIDAPITAYLGATRDEAALNALETLSPPLALRNALGRLPDTPESREQLRALLRATTAWLAPWQDHDDVRLGVEAIDFEVRWTRKAQIGLEVLERDQPGAAISLKRCLQRALGYAVETGGDLSQCPDLRSKANSPLLGLGRRAEKHRALVTVGARRFVLLRVYPVTDHDAYERAIQDARAVLDEETFPAPLQRLLPLPK